MCKEQRKEPKITHIMADGSILHSNEELHHYKIDPARVSPTALRIIRELIMTPPQKKQED